jgi:hypothetical protein
MMKYEIVELKDKPLPFQVFEKGVRDPVGQYQIRRDAERFKTALEEEDQWKAESGVNDGM